MFEFELTRASAEAVILLPYFDVINHLFDSIDDEPGNILEQTNGMSGGSGSQGRGGSSISAFIVARFDNGGHTTLTRDCIQLDLMCSRVTEENLNGVTAAHSSSVLVDLGAC